LNANILIKLLILAQLTVIRLFFDKKHNTHFFKKKMKASSERTILHIIGSSVKGLKVAFNS